MRVSIKTLAVINAEIKNLTLVIKGVIWSFLKGTVERQDQNESQYEKQEETHDYLAATEIQT